MKHSKDTIRKYIRRGNFYIAYYSQFDACDIKLCVSYGNKKIGRVLNVSKAPIFTCRGVCHKCQDFCYDIKACIQYTNVMDARIRNTVLFFKDRDEYFRQISEAMDKRKTNKFLRYDVGGEIVDSDEVRRLATLAKERPDFLVWTYTKNHRAVNEYMTANGGKLPGNLVIMFSRVNANEIENPYNLPEFNVVTDDEDGKEIDADYCGGDCVKCRAEGKGCTAGKSSNVKEH